MKVLVAMNSFKGSASAVEATRWVAAGLRLALPEDYVIEELSACDGGTGFCETITNALGGEVRPTYRAHDAAMRSFDSAKIGWISHHITGRTAVIEAADTVGLARLSDVAVSLMERTSFGLGEVIRSAIDEGADHIYVGFGDSGVQDVGIGLLEAMGAQFFDRQDRLLTGLKTKDLGRIERIAFSLPENAPAIELACNLSSVLEGSSATVEKYARQKGASEEDVRQLRIGTKKIAKVFANCFGTAVARASGSGANGGCGAALMAACAAVPRYSFQVVSEALGLRQKLSDAAVVVVGEGALDLGTVKGKAPGAIALLAAAHGVPAIAVAGSISPNTYGRLVAANICAVQTLSLPEQELRKYVSEAPNLIREAGLRLGEIVRRLCESSR